MTEDSKDDVQGTQPDTAQPRAEKPAGGSASNKTLWMGTAVGIGSAAIVAALLYANKRRKS